MSCSSCHFNHLHWGGATHPRRTTGSCLWMWMVVEAAAAYCCIVGWWQDGCYGLQYEWCSLSFWTSSVCKIEAVACIDTLLRSKLFAVLWKLVMNTVLCLPLRMIHNLMLIGSYCWSYCWRSSLRLKNVKHTAVLLAGLCHSVPVICSSSLYCWCWSLLCLALVWWVL